MPDEIRPLSDLMDRGDDPTGLLWLINRTVFHPHGLALALVPDDDGNIVGWQMQGDGTEPWSFSDEDDDQQFALVRAFLAGIVNDPMPDVPVIDLGGTASPD